KLFGIHLEKWSDCQNIFFFNFVLNKILEMNIKILLTSLSIASISVISCNQQGTNSNSAVTIDSTTAKAVAIKEEPVNYSVGGKNYDGYVTYDSNQVGKRPGVLVVHEWWGLTDYPRMRAKELA